MPFGTVGSWLFFLIESKFKSDIQICLIRAEFIRLTHANLKKNT